MESVINSCADVNVESMITAPFCLNTTTMEDWNVRKARLKEKFTKLIGEDLLAMADKHGEILSRLEKRLGKTRAAILKLISEL